MALGLQSLKKQQNQLTQWLSHRRRHFTSVTSATAARHTLGPWNCFPPPSPAVRIFLAIFFCHFTEPFVLLAHLLLTNFLSVFILSHFSHIFVFLMSVSLNFFVLCLGSTKLHAKIRLYTPLRMPGLTYISRRRNSVVIISLPKCMISNSKRAHTFQTRGTWWKGCDREREARFPPSAVSLLSSLAVSL